MNFEKFLKMMKETDDEEMNHVKEKLYLIKSTINDKNIFDMMKEKNPPMKAFKLCLGAQTVYATLYNETSFVDLKWLNDNDTYDRMVKECSTNLVGLDGVLWLIDCVNNHELAKKYCRLHKLIH